ncbi:glycosyltransferase family 2 protein [Microbulbifer agarilyticus]|uniref:glycosyltransferase family 2 protein n=1 Tax=Microbulbifer agarilyticus TaxID=260552 RepID=UPI001CD4CE4F|nr:glycosyltransferase family 2 protein [Microbulbifer agarilyticus]MCA0901404.1 glycosyltransferase family 2 protein [Microbulbifer agarilyticus]
MRRSALWAKQLLRSKLQKKVALNIDYMLQVPGKIVLSGWVGSRTDPATSISWSNGSTKSTLESKLFKFTRADVIGQLGFQGESHCFGFIVVIDGLSDVANLVASVNGISFPLAGQKFNSVTSPNIVAGQAGEKGALALKFIEKNDVASGQVATATAAITLDPEIMKIQTELGTLNLHAEDFVERARAGVLDRVQSVWKKRTSKPNPVRVVTHGVLPDDPALSIIVPIYGRYDFVQHQVASFSDDENFANVEVIYVLDDPSLKHEFLVTCEGVFKTFGLPFKLVVSTQNLGFAGANNLGVANARAERVLLLNSDILPSKPGWTQDLIKTFESLDNVGILGAALLYEDNSVQHMAMEFRRDSSFPGLWLNHHPCKGMPWDLVKSRGVTKVQLTTGACMLMKKSLYEEVGGFDPLYVLGDFEDSDLCLKVLQHGFDIYVDNDVVLYHLERLSQGLVSEDNWKTKLTMLNNVHQLNKWESQIERVVEE